MHGVFTTQAHLCLFAVLEGLTASIYTSYLLAHIKVHIRVALSKVGLTVLALSILRLQVWL
jgi:hypothetical protein